MKTLPRNILALLVTTTILTSCASAPRKRFMIGAGAGAVTGAVGGAVLSPNSESRGLNTLVFGLIGTVVGGLLGLLIHDDAEIPETKKSDQSTKTDSPQSQEFALPPSTQELPAFVKERLKPVVVEELHEPDSISEDGSLHEPHKVYRIKRPAELIANPINEKKAAK